MFVLLIEQIDLVKVTWVRASDGNSNTTDVMIHELDKTFGR